MEKIVNSRTKRRFTDRYDAGRAVADLVSRSIDDQDVVVLALPRGGVPVAAVVAERLDAPLDVVIVRKVGAPRQPELAIGAVASGGVFVRNEEIIDALGIPDHVIEQQGERQLEAVRAREQRYRRGRRMTPVAGRNVILVDDGIATGSSMLAAIRAIELSHPSSVVVAVPVAPAETCVEFERQGVTIHCVSTPTPFRAVGQWYDDFGQTTDEDVERLLDEAHARCG